MKCKIIFEDWKQIGKAESIYDTELGLSLSSGDFHSGTTLDAEITIEKHLEEEIIEAMEKHKAYPVFSIIKKGN